MLARGTQARIRSRLAVEATIGRQAGQEVITVLERLHHDGGTVMLVTHDPEVGARARRRVRMVDGAVVSDERP